MAVDLGPGFPPDFPGIPPHVSAEDLTIWEGFRRRFGSRYRRLFFDVALGRGAPIEGNVAPSVAVAWERLTRFRADVVGDTGDAWEIIELRPNAGPGAIGSLQVYTTLWLEGPPDARPVRAVLGTDRCARDIRLVGQLAGIEVICLDELPPRAG